MKRYSLELDYCGIGEDANGEWVRYSDHVEAMKRIAGARVAQGLTREDARDAARYRWIAQNAHFTGSYKNVGGFGVCVKLDVLESEGIGAAIDAAMSASKGGA